MKIRKLVIHNIASIIDATIDFDKGSLATDPLFLITGDTGTGKSTILNAIALALYDKVPSLESIGTAADDKEGVKTNNTRQLMRRATAEAYVELTFDGNDGHGYKAVWSVQRAYRKVTGNMGKSARALHNLDTGETLTGKMEINDRIQRLVGLTFEQFTRTTMLAQGQFAAFMKAPDGEKSEILEKLTGTEIYAKIGMRIFAKKREVESRRDTLRAEIEGASMLSDAERSEIAARIGEAATLVASTGTKLEQVDTQLGWLRTAEALMQSARQKNAALLEATEALQSPTHKDEAALVGRWDDTTAIRALLKRLGEGVERLNEIETRLNNQFEVELPKVADGMAYVEERDGIIADEIAKLESKIGEMEPREGMLANAQRIEQMAQQVEESKRQLQKLAERLKRAEKQGALTAKEIEKMAGEVKRVADLTAARQLKVTELEEGMKGVDREKCNERYTSLRSEHDHVMEARRSVADLLEARRGYNEADEALKGAKDEIADTEGKLADLEKQLPGAKDDYERMQRSVKGYEGLKAQLAAIRQRFDGTHTCPLCGTPDVTLHTDDEIDETLKALLEGEGKAKALYEELTQAANALNARKEEQSKGMKRCEKALKSAEKNLKGCQKVVATAIEEVKGVKIDPEQEDVLYIIDKYIATLGEDLHAAEAEHNRVQKLQNELTDALRSLNEARAEKAKVDLLMAEKEKRAKHTAIEIAGVKEQMEGLEKGIATTVEAVKKLSDASTAQRLDASNMAECARAIVEDAKTYASLLTQRDNKKGERRDCQHLLGRCKSASEKLMEKLSLEYAAEPVELPEIEETIRNIATTVSTIEGERHREQEEQRSLKCKIDDYFATAEYTPEAVAEISVNSEETIEQLRGKVTTRIEAQRKAQTEVEVVREQQKMHDTTRPELDDGATIGTLSASKQELTTLKEGLMTEKSQLEERLRHDDALAVKLATKRKTLAEVEVKLQHWTQLESIFGGADGKKFRLIAQSFVLRALLTKSNYYLSMLSPRYRLQCEDGQLTINVVDMHQAGAVRNVGLLSGGEGFIVSLALALGLSAISKGCINVDILFIDEGFGTLDKEILEVVISTLDRLHQIGGRRIGIISHVAELKERIPTQLRLVRCSPSASRVEVVP